MVSEPHAKVRDVRALMGPIEADPERRANLARHRAGTLAEIGAYHLRRAGCARYHRSAPGVRERPTTAAARSVRG